MAVFGCLKYVWGALFTRARDVCLLTCVCVPVSRLEVALRCVVEHRASVGVLRCRGIVMPLSKRESREFSKISLLSKRKERKQTNQTRDGRRTGSPPARAGSWKDDQGHRGTGVGSASPRARETCRQGLLFGSVGEGRDFEQYQTTRTLIVVKVDRRSNISLSPTQDRQNKQISVRLRRSATTDEAWRRGWARALATASSDGESGARWRLRPRPSQLTTLAVVAKERNPRVTAS